MRFARRSGVSQERGAAALEFALVTPLLLAFIFGIVQFAMIFAQSSALANAARSGARLGAVNALAMATCQDVVDATRGQALSLGMEPTQVAVTVRREDALADVAALAGGSALCDVGSGSSQVSGASGSIPCDEDASSQRLVVTAKFDAVVSLPFVPEMTIPRTATGVYRCES